MGYLGRSQWIPKHDRCDYCRAVREEELRETPLLCKNKGMKQACAMVLRLRKTIVQHCEVLLQKRKGIA
jgi:hypothetical protein